MTKAVKARRYIGLVLICGALSCFIWGRFRLAPKTSVEIPIRVTDDTKLELPFFVAADGAYYVELRYPRSASTRFWKDFHGLSGTALLSSEGVVMSRILLPVDRAKHDAAFIAVILFPSILQKGKRYTLSLFIDHVPPNLQNNAALVVEADPHSYAIVTAVRWVGVLLALVGVWCAVPFRRLYLSVVRRSGEGGVGWGRV